MLAGAAAGGGLLVAWLAWPRGSGGGLVRGPGDRAFGAWLQIGTDSVVTVAVPQLEMGQGVTTLLPQIVAAELGADWRQVAVQPVPPLGEFANVPLAAALAPLWMPFAPGLAAAPDGLLPARWARANAFAATAFGTSLAAFEDPCRQAGAAARAMLLEVAARRLGVPVGELEVADGLVRHGARRLPFGVLAAEAAELSVPGDPPLRPNPVSELPGVAGGPVQVITPRLDLPSKADGSLLFAGDVRLPDMVFASIRHGPVGLPELAAFDRDAARGMAGLVGVVEGERFLAACARSWWIAERALEAMRPRFRGPRGADSDAVARTLLRALETERGEAVAGWGDAGQAEPGGPGRFSATYTLDAAQHAPLETASATARFSEGRLELWIAAQAPAEARRAAARAVGLSEEDVVLYPMPAGGSFDARLSHLHAAEVAQIAKAVRRPVQLVWPRRQEFLATPPRPPLAARLTVAALPGGEGQPAAWQAVVAAPPAMREWGARTLDGALPEAAADAAEGQADALLVGGFAPPYTLPAAEVRHVPVRLAMPTGPMRGNAAALAAFATECFTDELARRAGREPLSFRINMLGEDPALARVLQEAASLAQWDGGSQTSAQGLACVRMGVAEPGARAGRIACIAEARMGERGVAVSRLLAAVDIGRIVNLDLARQQIEGGLLFGMAFATGGSARYAGGLPAADRLGALGLPRLADTPEIVISFVRNERAPPFDPGELGAAVAAPAIANALFAATGRRIRRLPLFPPQRTDGRVS